MSKGSLQKIALSEISQEIYIVARVQRKERGFQELEEERM
jgi:hypothetical protein